MIYVSADDYGLCNAASMNIQKCIDEGALNKVSVFPNIEKVDFERIADKNNISISLHLNLVEGKCMADASEINLIADAKGNFKHTFGGLLKNSIFYPKKFYEQAYKEVRAQVLFWKNILPEGAPFLIDSHQHTHMIPGIFKALLKVLSDEKINLDYIRVPAEPILPFLKKPSLYLTYRPVNIIKQWLLKFLWVADRAEARGTDIPTAYFFGILFSGKMDERVEKILPEYEKLAEKNGKNIEVLFHPGYLDKNEPGFVSENIVFEKFYLSENRKTEFDSLMNLTERSVYNALY